MTVLPVRILAAAASVWAGGAAFAASACSVASGPQITPVIELYTSEGCSSCPPADQWLSGLKSAAAQGRVVAQAFHVGYWDYIGWVDRFATPAYTMRQKQVAANNRLSGIYTPQLVRNGQDWRDYTGALSPRNEPSQAAIKVTRTESGTFEADVAPVNASASWSAYWTVTENGHASKVKAGENAGEFLQHDFVVRQYVPAGQYSGTQHLKLRAVAPEGNRRQQVNLVVFEPKTGKPLQAVSLACS